MKKISIIIAILITIAFSVPSFTQMTLTLPIQSGLSKSNYVGCPSGDENPPASNTGFEDQVVALVNNERSLQGLSVLTVHPDLARAARYYAKDMVDDNYYQGDHATYDRNGDNLIKVCEAGPRILAFYTDSWLLLGENIAAEQTSPQAVMDAWMNSPGHRENILNPDFSHIGVGYYQGGFYSHYWVQDFIQSVPLPVELSSFRYIFKDGVLFLEWITAAERNNMGFEVYCKSSGDFELIGFVEGHGTSAEEHKYSFQLGRMAPGKYLHMLKQIDTDGSFSDGPGIMVEIPLEKTLHLSQACPNPFNPKTQFSVTIANDQNVCIEVLNVLGKHMATLHDGWLRGGVAHSFTIQGAGWPSGIYLYQITGEDGYSASRKVTLLK